MSGAKDSMTTRVYSPGSSLRRPKVFLMDAWHDLMSSRELAWRLTIRDFSALYRQSFAGYVWAFLPPLVAAFTFILLRRGGAVRTEGLEMPYVAFALIGTLLWQIFVDALNNPLKFMETSKQMLIKVNFPRESLPLAAVQMTLIGLGIRMLILIPVFLWFRFPVTLSLLLFPIGLMLLVLLGTGFGLLLAPLSALYKDVRQAITMLTTFWMFLTPVVFPQIRGGFIGDIIRYNPVTPVLSTTRDWLTGTPSSSVSGFIIVAALTFSGLLFGWLMFRLFLPRVIERMGM